MEYRGFSRFYLNIKNAISVNSPAVYILFIGASLLFEYVMRFRGDLGEKPEIVFAFILAAICLFTSLIKNSRLLFALFFFSCAFMTLESEIRYAANHVLLCFWLLGPLMISPAYSQTVTYRDYLARTIGMVMVVAATQKLISGNYINGAYLKYLVNLDHGIEQLFGLACFDTAYADCNTLVYLSVFSIAYQYVIGFLLLSGCRHYLALLLELSFVVTVGVITNEMNFQTINVAALLLAFRVQPNFRIVIILSSFLIIDFVSLDWLFARASL